MKTIVITGASDGIGAAAARELSGRGHHVVVVGRSAEKTQRLGDELGTDRHVVDFAALAEVRRLAADLLQSCPRIDVLANNAGGIFGSATRTVDGFDLTVQVNHLAPFLLTSLLLPRLIESHASVIQTSSAAARLTGRIDLHDRQHARDFSPERAYGTTKLQNILFTQELHRRYADAGLASAAFHPGLVASSFASNTTSPARLMYQTPVARLWMKSSAQGAGQLVWLAEGTPGSDWISGTYYERYRPARRVHPQTKDPRVAAALWNQSEELLGIAERPE